MLSSLLTRKGRPGRFGNQIFGLEGSSSDKRKLGDIFVPKIIWKCGLVTQIADFLGDVESL